MGGHLGLKELGHFIEMTPVIFFYVMQYSYVAIYLGDLD